MIRDIHSALQLKTARRTGLNGFAKLQQSRHGVSAAFGAKVSFKSGSANVLSGKTMASNTTTKQSLPLKRSVCWQGADGYAGRLGRKRSTSPSGHDRQDAARHPVSPPAVLLACICPVCVVLHPDIMQAACMLPHASWLTSEFCFQSGDCALQNPLS